MKKLLSVLLCAVMLAGTVLAAVPGAAQASDYNKLTEAPADLAGAVGSYDSYLDAAKIEIAAGGSAAFTISGTGSEDTYLIAMLPAAYGAGSVGITVGETSAALTASHKFTAVSVGSADSISVGYRGRQRRCCRLPVRNCGREPPRRNACGSQRQP